MKYYTPLFLLIALMACNSSTSSQNIVVQDQSEITNPKLKDYPFLQGMYDDDWFPEFLVDKGKHILVGLCLQIEKEQPQTLPELYALTHAATEQFNALQYEFDANGSEMETVAREVIALDFDYIAAAYGFEADMEELIAPREW